MIECGGVDFTKKKSIFFVGNHVSYLDIFVYCSLVLGSFVAKIEISRWPIVGFFVKLGKTYFIDRSKKTEVKRVYQSLKAHFNLGNSVILFPEGKTSDGTEIKPLKSSFLEVCCQSQLPVYYGVVRYISLDKAYEAKRDIAWCDGRSFFFHFIRLLGNFGIEARVSFGKEALFFKE